MAKQPEKKERASALGEKRRRPDAGQEKGFANLASKIN